MRTLYVLSGTETRYSLKKAEMQKVAPVTISFEFVPFMMGM
jgi:hypothetical protein